MVTSKDAPQLQLIFGKSKQNDYISLYEILHILFFPFSKIPLTSIFEVRAIKSANNRNPRFLIDKST